MFRHVALEDAVLTPSCLALQDSFRQLPFPSQQCSTAALVGGFLEEVAAPAHRTGELGPAVPMPTRGHSVETLQKAWHLLG